MGIDPFVGEIGIFAGTFAPRGWQFCDGQLMPIAQNTALFSLLGTTYGGDGVTTFALPDLRGRAAIHAGNGPGLTPRSLGQKVGTPDVTLTVPQMPAHGHGLPWGADTSDTGGGQPHTNLQPSLAVNYIIALEGIYPSRNDIAPAGFGNEPLVGEVSLFGGTFAPRGWALCDGQLLAISQNSALFSLLGTTYGGDGITTFALPDLRGRAALHEGQGPGLTARTLGQELGAENVTLATAQLPAHTHTLPPGADLTDPTGGGAAHENMQPSLALNYIIAMQGVFPSRNDITPLSLSGEPVLGEISLFAGNFAPRGWEFCDGQLLPIASNAALFSLLGTTYGGDGMSTFALPDLRSRIPVHEGSSPGTDVWSLGEKGGGESLSLTTAQLPAHDHTYDPTVIPEPATLALAGLAVAGLGAYMRRRRKSA